MQGYGMMALASMIPNVRLTSLPCDKDVCCRPSPSKVVFFDASLYLVAVAQGADKSCGLAFAADQFDPDNPKESAARSSLFYCWYFSMAFGVSVGSAIVSYIQENVGWGAGFGTLCAVMLCTFAVFLVGTPTYRLYDLAPGAKSPFGPLVRSLVSLATNSSTKNHHREQGEEAAHKPEEEAARGVLRLLAIWATCLAYGVVIAQVMTLFNKQATTLDLSIFGGMELSPTALQTFGPVAALLSVVAYDTVLVPALRRVTGNPSGLTPLQRMGVGMALSLVSVAVAALVEARRLETAREHGLVDDAGATVPMSWAWLVPQNVLIWVAGAFAEVGMHEFFYNEMSSELRSVGVALFYSMIGISSFISGALISLINLVTMSGGGDSWFADNLNRAHLDYFYYLLAGLSTAELALFLFLASSYVYSHQRGSTESEN